MTSTPRKIYAAGIAITSIGTSASIGHYTFPSTLAGITASLITGLFLGSIGGYVAFKTWMGKP